MTQASYCGASEVVTRGIRVTVRSQYLPDRSSESSKHFVFAYTVTIANESVATVKLESRHWIIRHGDGRVEEVQGSGVVGEQPVLAPGSSFEYTSGCVLQTARGAMHGKYQMSDANGAAFEVDIGQFDLEKPYSLN